MTSPDKPRCPTCGHALTSSHSIAMECTDPWHQGDGGQAGPMPCPECLYKGKHYCSIHRVQTPKTPAAPRAEVSSLSKTEDPSQLSKHRTNASSSPVIGSSITPPTSFAAEVRRVFADRGFANDYALAPGGKTSTDYDIAAAAIIEAVEKRVIGGNLKHQPCVHSLAEGNCAACLVRLINDHKTEQRRHLHE